MLITYFQEECWVLNPPERMDGSIPTTWEVGEHIESATKGFSRAVLVITSNHHFAKKLFQTASTNILMFDTLQQCCCHHYHVLECWQVDGIIEKAK